MTLDLGLVKATLAIEDLNPVVESGVEEFLQGDGKTVWDMVRKHYGEFGVFPDHEAIKRSVGGLVASNLADAQEQPVSYFISSIRKRALSIHLDEGLREVIEEIKGGKPEDAMDRVKTMLHAASAMELERGKGTDLIKTRNDRISEYLRVKAIGDAVDGWHLPWQTANKVTQGLHPGEVSFFVGRLYVGKTWNLLETMIPLIKNGAKILIITMEMPALQLGRRIDSLMGRFNYNDLRKGRLSDDDFMRYQTMLDVEYPKYKEVWCYGPPRVKTVTDIELLVEQHKPDIVLIDGVYLIGGGGVTDRFTKVLHAGEELKHMAIAKNVSVVGTIQFGRQASQGKRKDRMDGDAEDVGYSYGLAQIADNMFGLFQNEDFRVNKHLLIKFLKVREAEKSRGIVINWDFDAMNFSEVGIWTGDEVLPTDAEGNIIAAGVGDDDTADDTDSLSF